MNEGAASTVEGDHDPHNRPLWTRQTLIAVAALLVGIGVAWVAFTQDSTNDIAASTTTTIQSEASLGVPTTIVVPPPTSTTSTTDSYVPPTPGTLPSHTASVVPLDDATSLMGSLALMSSPHGGELWVIRDDGTVVHRDDVPFGTGDFPYPLLMTGRGLLTPGAIIFANLTDGYVIDANLVNEPEPLTEASFVVPGSNTDEVWFVGRDVEWVASVHVESRTYRERFRVADLFWPIAGFGDGLVVYPRNEEAFGRVAYWSPIEGLQPLNLAIPPKVSYSLFLGPSLR